MSDYTTSTMPGQSCHRCGKPSGGSYLNNLPTCVWCIGEMPTYRVPETNTANDLLREQVTEQAARIAVLLIEHAAHMALLEAAEQHIHGLYYVPDTMSRCPVCPGVAASRKWRGDGHE